MTAVPVLLENPTHSCLLVLDRACVYSRAGIAVLLPVQVEWMA